MIVPADAPVRLVVQRFPYAPSVPVAAIVHGDGAHRVGKVAENRHQRFRGYGADLKSICLAVDKAVYGTAFRRCVFQIYVLLRGVVQQKHVVPRCFFGRLPGEGDLSVADGFGLQSRHRSGDPRRVRFRPRFAAPYRVKDGHIVRQGDLIAGIIGRSAAVRFRVPALQELRVLRRRDISCPDRVEDCHGFALQADRGEKAVIGPLGAVQVIGQPGAVGGKTVVQICLTFRHISQHIFPVRIDRFSDGVGLIRMEAVPQKGFHHGGSSRLRCKLRNAENLILNHVGSIDLLPAFFYRRTEIRLLPCEP